MGDSFKELLKEQKLALNVIKEEENSFLKTLEQGLDILEDVIKNSVKVKYLGIKFLNFMTLLAFHLILQRWLLAKKDII